VNGVATCAECGCSYFKERSVRPLCARCEAEDDAFRQHIAECVRGERDPVFLKHERDRLRPIALPGKRQQTPSAPRTVSRWVRTPFGFSLRSFPVAEPVERGRWGEPLR